MKWIFFKMLSLMMNLSYKFTKNRSFPMDCAPLHEHPRLHLFIMTLDYVILTINYWSHWNLLPSKCCQIENNIVRCPNPEYAEKMIAAIDDVRVRGDSVGGVVTCIVRNVPRVTPLPQTATHPPSLCFSYVIVLQCLCSCISLWFWKFSEKSAVPC